MDQLRSNRRLHVDVPSDEPVFDDDDDGSSGAGSEKMRKDDEALSNNGDGDEEGSSFMSGKARRRASMHMDYQGDYLDVPSNTRLTNILHKHG